MPSVEYGALIRTLGKRRLPALGMITPSGETHLRGCQNQQNAEKSKYSRSISNTDLASKAAMVDLSAVLTTLQCNMVEDDVGASRS